MCFCVTSIREARKEEKEKEKNTWKLKAGNFEIEMEALLVSILVCKHIFQNNSVSKTVDQTIENKNHNVLVRMDLKFLRSHKNTKIVEKVVLYHKLN